MATLDELAEALIVAEQQGDAEAVSVLAQAYQEQKAAQTQAPVLQDTGQGRFTSALSNVARGVTSVGPNVVGGLGYLTGSETLQEAGGSMEGALNRAFPVNPLYAGEFSQKAANVIGQAGGTLATGGVGGSIGKALGGASAIGKGAQAGALIPAFLAGTRGGGQEAERYGMTGGSAYARALLGGGIELASEKFLFGLGTETDAARRLLGESLDFGKGAFLKAAGTEAGEEAAAQIGGNLATMALAPEGVETPGAFEGTLESAALGAVGGSVFGGINALTGQPRKPVLDEEGNQVTVEGQPVFEDDLVPPEELPESVAPLTVADVEDDPVLEPVIEAASETVVENADVLPITNQVLQEINATPETETLPGEPVPEIEAEAPAQEAPVEPTNETAQVEIPEAGGPVAVEQLAPEAAPEDQAQEGVEVGESEGAEVAVAETDEEKFARIKATKGSLRTDEDIAWANEYSKRLRDTSPSEPVRKRQDAYVETFGPMQKARVSAALDKQVQSRDRLISRADLVQEMVGDGARIVPHPTDGRKLQRPNGSFIEESRLTKTGMDYAAYLIAETPVAETPVAETPVAETPVAPQQRTPSRAATPTPQAGQQVQFRREGKPMSGIYRGRDRLGRHIVESEGREEFVASTPAVIENSPVQGVTTPETFPDKGVQLSAASMRSRGRRGLTVQETEAIAQNFSKALRKGPPVRVVTAAQIANDAEFAEVRDAVGNVGGKVNQVEGWFDRRTNTVFLVADQVANARRARQVLIHEVIGHGGVMSVATPAEMRRIADIIRRVAPRIVSSVETYYKEASEAEKVREILARFSEDYTSADPANLPQGWKRAWEEIKQIVRAIIKEMGGDPNAFDDLDLHRFYTNAVRAVYEEGIQPTQESDTMMSLNYPGTEEAKEEIRRQEEAGVTNARETRARFAPADKENLRYIPTTEAGFKEDAEAFMDSLPLEEAAQRVLDGQVPENLRAGEDGRQHVLVAEAIRRLTVAIDSATDPYEQSRYLALANQLALKYAREGTADGRALKSRATANTLLAPIAPVLAAQRIMRERITTVLDSRFDGGTEGVTDKVRKVSKDAAAQASEDVAAELEEDTEVQDEEILSEAEELREQSERQAEQIIASLVKPNPESQTQVNRVRQVYKEHMRSPMTEEAFVSRLTALGVSPETSTSLFNVAQDELRGRELARKIREKQKAEGQAAEGQKSAERIIQSLVRPAREGQSRQDPVRDLYRQHMESPFTEEVFIQRLGEHGVDASTAQSLFRAAEQELRGRELAAQLRSEAAADRRVTLANSRASQLIYRTEERLRQGSKDLETNAAGDSINRAFRDQVKRPLDLPEFRARLAALNVSEEVADRLHRTAAREAADRAAMAEVREQIKQRKKTDAILAKDSPKLVELLNKLRKKMFPGTNWRTIFEDLPDQQLARQKAIYDRLRKDERLRNLTTEEGVALTNELDKAWQRQRRKVFLEDLRRQGVLGEKDATDRKKVEKAFPKILRALNLGTFNSELMREAMASEYGIRTITAQEAAELRKLAQEAYQQPEGILRDKKVGEVMHKLQNATGSSLSELVNNYWVASVLSGTATMFDTYMSAFNGLGNNLLQAGALFARGQRGDALAAVSQWFEGLRQGARESMLILAKGDYSVLKRFTTDLNKAMEGDPNFRPVPLGESLWRNGNAFQKYGMAPVMLWTGRLMSAADHINNTATSYGAMAVARALHPEFYEGKGAFTKQEKDAAREQAVREVTGGTEPQTLEDKATVSKRTREILAGLLRPEQQDEANFIGDQAAYQNDPLGLFGSIYRGISAGIGTIERGAEALSTDPAIQSQFMRAILGGLAGGLRGLTGTKFMRFGFNFGNDITQYIPGTYLLQKLAPVYGTKMSRSQQDLLLGKNIFGLMAAVGVAALFLDKDDDEEGWHLEGNWSGLNNDFKNQLRSQGKEPNTFWRRRPDGSIQRISYRSWPTSGIMVAVGRMVDQRRYQPAKWKEYGVAGNLLSAVGNGAIQVKDTTALSGLSELLGASSYSTDPEKSALERLAKTAFKFEGGFFPTLLKDIDSWEDPNNYRPETLLGEMVRHVPLARRAASDGRPMLNLLGEPVELSRVPWRRVYTESKEGPEYTVLGQLLSRGLSLPEPSSKRTVKVNGQTTTIEQLGPRAEWEFARILGEKYRDFLLREGPTLERLDNDRAEKRIRKRAQDLGDQAEAEMVRLLKPTL